MASLGSESLASVPSSNSDVVVTKRQSIKYKQSYYKEMKLESVCDNLDRKLGNL